jgi:hypothetical protein
MRIWDLNLTNAHRRNTLYEEGPSFHNSFLNEFLVQGKLSEKFCFHRYGLFESSNDIGPPLPWPFLASRHEMQRQGGQ